MNIIHLLPDAVANQIAAGEVIQRPASIVKELMENAIDARATDIKVLVQDAGRTQIQVIDDGCGMSADDAKMAFLRHATSKISEARDLYALRTMGFRGEALASIAAVAQVELLTREEGQELGVRVVAEGGDIHDAEPCATPQGSRFSVKNLFYNIPARRNFLKSDNVELRHICSEFLRVALAHPSVSVSLLSNGTTLYNLPVGNIKQRVAGAAGHSMAQHLLSIETDTSIVKISGYVGTPETAKKTGGDQYFFANNRYMRSAYFNKAIIDAYKGIIAADHVPAYYIYFDIDPKCIDVNVHPQKTEIKFDDEQAIWKILNATVSSCLNDNNILPSIDFESGERVPIPTFDPKATSGDNYNPFAREREQANQYADYVRSSIGQSGYPSDESGYRRRDISGWEAIYSAVGGSQTIPSAIGGGSTGGQTTIASSIGEEKSKDASFSGGAFFGSAVDQPQSSGSFMQMSQRYVITTTASGLMVIDQHRAHERILYNKMKAQMAQNAIESQMLLFAETVVVGTEDLCILSELTEELRRVGISIEIDNEKGMVKITSIPAMMDLKSVRELLETITYDCRTGEVNINDEVVEYMVRSLSKHGAIPYGRTLTQDEMSSLFDALMTSNERAYTPSGKPTYKVISDRDVETLFRN